MTALPGQRAAQRPLRAMAAAQRVLGRAAKAGDGGLVGPIGVAFIGGKKYQVDLSAPAGAQLTPLAEDGPPVPPVPVDQSGSTHTAGRG